jgi:hypothetical protein
MEVAGIALDGERMLDGISLLPVLEGAIDSRPKPMGFWEYPESGVRTPSSEWMAELLAAQTEGREPEDKWKLRLDAGEIKEIYGEDLLPGHAAWVDGDWKLHRIADKSGEQFRLELYDLAKDPGEEVDLKEGEPERTERMVRSLEVWQRSVIRSLNGEDYR